MWEKFGTSGRGTGSASVIEVESTNGVGVEAGKGARVGGKAEGGESARVGWQAEVRNTKRVVRLKSRMVGFMSASFG
jgi:hypothetical protein